MSTYAIGDIQGCFLTLQRLLDRIRFNPGNDRLWLVGDLVNRGPRSLEVLRWACQMGAGIVAVLGNHDLHLLSRAAGVAPPKRHDTLEPILKAPDRDELLDWLRRLPLFHREGNFAMVHGGLAPEWSLQEAASLAAAAETALRGPEGAELLASVASGAPHRWEAHLQGMDRLRAIIVLMTRIRVCRSDGTLRLDFKGAPEQAPSGYFPWYEAPARKKDAATIVFGHWAALGLRLGDKYLALDSGCVWGKSLSAIRLEDRQVFQEACADFTTS